MPREHLPALQRDGSGAAHGGSVTGQDEQLDSAKSANCGSIIAAALTLTVLLGHGSPQAALVASH